MRAIKRILCNPFNYILILCGLVLAGSGQRSSPLIIDHTCTDITKIPQEWIEAARDSLHIAYGHTSHGSQLTTGMTGLVAFANNGGKGLSLPQDIFAWNEGGTDGALDLRDGVLGGDVGYYPDWVDNTIAYLGEADSVTGRGKNRPDVNVIIWSWCGQVESKYILGTLQSEYLDPMSELEKTYFNVTFVYMTGHVNIWEDAENKAANKVIYDSCMANNKVLYDFADIEHYNPDGVYFEYVNDNCDYYNEETQKLGNWATEWQDSHTENVDWYTCSSAHSEPLNANQKAFAAWWLWAKLAGWNEDQPIEYAAPVVINPLADTTINEDCGRLVLLNDIRTIFSQPDSGDQFSYSLSSQNQQLGWELSGFQLIVQPDANYYGSGMIKLTAENSQGKQCVYTTTIKISPVNDPPLIVGLPDSLHFNSDSSITLMMNQFQQDIDSDKLFWHFAANNPVLVCKYDSGSTQLSLSAPSFSGRILLTCTLSDDSSASVTDSIRISVEQSTNIPGRTANRAPQNFLIYPNFPNPFNPQTTIRYNLPEAAEVVVTIYDVVGNRICTIVKEWQAAGENRVIWDGLNDLNRPVSSGIYYYRVRTSRYSATRKMILTR